MLKKENCPALLQNPLQDWPQGRRAREGTQWGEGKRNQFCAAKNDRVRGWNLRVKVLGVIFPSQDNKLGNSQVSGKRLAERRLEACAAQGISDWESPSVRHWAQRWGYRVEWAMNLPSKSSDCSWRARGPGCLGHSRGKDQILWKPEAAWPDVGQGLREAAVVLSLAGWVGRPANRPNRFELESLWCSNQKPQTSGEEAPCADGKFQSSNIYVMFRNGPVHYELSVRGVISTVMWAEAWRNPFFLPL